jgi:hypothetical protein
MKHPLTTLASLLAVLAAGTATPSLAELGTPGARRATQEASKAAPSVKEVMTTMTVPSSDAIFAAAYEPPKEPAQWVALRASAKVLADSGRVLTTVPRAKGDAEWTEMARALVNSAEATFKAIDTKDADALAAASDEVFLTCKTCHDRYNPQ